MHNYVDVRAKYVPTGSRRSDGNPYIEALPELGEGKDDFVNRLANLPEPPTNADRRAGEVVRLLDLEQINEIVYQLSAYKRAATNATVNLRASYVGRNPVTGTDQARHQAIVDNRGNKFPSDLRSTGKGQALLGLSGCSKTTFAHAFSLPYRTVIHHKSYKDQILEKRQIPWVPLRIPHDGTLRSLCLQFCRTIDELLGDTRYAQRAEKAKSIALMALILAAICSELAIGLVFVDELQNLRAAKSGHAEIVLNFLSEIIEAAGVSLCIAGTPAVQQVISTSARNLRKLTMGGESRFDLLDVKSGEWANFANAHWDYQWVKNKKDLTPETMAAWYNCSLGNPAFAELSFILAQRLEIGGREFIDELSFQRVAQFDMASLAPALNALKTQDPKLLKNFDDLYFWNGMDPVRGFINRDNKQRIQYSKTGAENQEPPNEEDTSEFSEITETIDEQIRRQFMNTKNHEPVKRKNANALLPTVNPINPAPGTPKKQ